MYKKIEIGNLKAIYYITSLTLSVLLIGGMEPLVVWRWWRRRPVAAESTWITTSSDMVGGESENCSSWGRRSISVPQEGGLLSPNNSEPREEEEEEEEGLFMRVLIWCQGQGVCVLWKKAHMIHTIKPNLLSIGNLTRAASLSLRKT